jgi:hypothetical protein
MVQLLKIFGLRQEPYTEKKEISEMNIFQFILMRQMEKSVQCARTSKYWLTNLSLSLKMATLLIKNMVVMFGLIATTIGINAN